jgi:predicted nucleic acid-binding protein
MIIVDTTVWIAYLAGLTNAHTEWLAREMNLQPLGLTDLILCEVLQGIQNGTTFAKVRRDLHEFSSFEMGGEALAVAATQNHRSLRARGYTVRKTIDCWIATFCLMEGHILLHRDRDFDLFEEHLGLQVMHPHAN